MYTTIIQFKFWSYCVLNPPSATNAALCMKLPSGDARKVMASPISSIFPMRLSGAFTTSWPMTESASLPPELINKGVSMKPGHMALMRMPCWAYPLPSPLVKPTTPRSD